MTAPAYNPNPERETVSLGIVDAGLAITNFISYRYTESFTTPSDAFSFVIEDAYFDDLTRSAVVPGAKVTLTLEGNAQCTGYIDSVEKSADRSSGVVWTISGRDVLGQAIDCGIDPTTNFNPGFTLDQFLAAVFAPYGWSQVTHFADDNSANRGVITGQKRGTPTSKKGKPLKKFVLHQLKPYPKEGAYAFAARVCQRQGLWIWPSSDGQQLVVGKPDFEQTPYTLLQRLNNGGGTNVLSGSVKFDVADQPNIILADGFAGGASFGHSKMQALMVNPAVTYQPGGVGANYQSIGAYTTFLAKYPRAVRLPPRSGAATYVQQYTPTLRVMYLHDDESKTPDELANFVYRQMALQMQHGLRAHYTVYGHGQIFGDGAFTPWAVNTVVDVQDEVGGLTEPMWVLSRTFNKSRRSGTTTDLELIRLYSLDL